jgi:hypothetical protein
MGAVRPQTLHRSAAAGIRGELLRPIEDGRFGTIAI